jgi:predicted metal-dependent hydrolase
VSPFPYTVRVSPRARRVLLKVSRDRGLEVVVPAGYDQRRIPAVLADRADWLARTLAALPADPGLPERIPLPALGREVAVDRLHRPGQPPRLVPSGPDRLLLRGDTVGDDGLPACRRLLTRFVRAEAERTLVPWLREVSLELGLPFADARIRSQRTRWGSCSAAGTINLNARLLFLKPALVRYIFVHELCHLVRMDHSPDYWRLVVSHLPDGRDLDREMRRAGRAVPAWWLD